MASFSYPPQENLRAAQIQGISRRMVGIVRIVSKLPFSRRRFMHLVFGTNNVLVRKTRLESNWFHEFRKLQPCSTLNRCDFFQRQEITTSMKMSDSEERPCIEEGRSCIKESTKVAR
ncbi:unnamed protein product [Arabis nemorensis]|uniref:Uncharacterized protein n=1 Tax=Arabis nemorensis TaxID=586526 RepID=A0A565C8I2_9BRAS|nr:unnamed protein product [Arabis nemorensis]